MNCATQQKPHRYSAAGNKKIVHLQSKILNNMALILPVDKSA